MRAVVVDKSPRGKPEKDIEACGESLEPALCFLGEIVSSRPRQSLSDPSID